MASPLHRHRSSLEGVILPPSRHLNEDEHRMAVAIFDQIIAEFEPSQSKDIDYKPITLIRLLKDSVKDASGFLMLFFAFIENELQQDVEIESLEIDLSQVFPRYVDFFSWDMERRNALDNSLVIFAKYLIDNFFLPLKALAVKTPQPTPASISRSQLLEQVTGTPQRVAGLRHDCLVRDRHRCVVSRKFDAREAQNRFKKHGYDLKDDDGNLLSSSELALLEVAHIIPHSLMSLTNIEGEQKLTEPKRIALQILDMFDSGAIHLIDGPNIDRPMNALTLTFELHNLFGSFEIQFEPVPTEPHTYKIDYIQPERIFLAEQLPVTVTLYLTSDRSIDPPSPRLLAIHRAIGHILHLSAVGDYIDKFLRDMEEQEVRADGSTRLDDYIQFKLADWVHTATVY